MEKLSLICSVHGACSGNPGVMGLGGAVYEEHTRNLLYSFCVAEGQGSKNIAELYAFIKAVKIIRQLGKQIESILFQFDSQLLYCQLSYGIGLENEMAAELYGEIVMELGGLGCSVKFQWVSLQENLFSHAMAARAAGMPFAEVKNGRVILWDKHSMELEKGQLSNKCYQDMDTELPAINPDTYIAIQKLNCSKHADVSLIFSLMTYGIDKYSRAKLELLLKCIELRFGSYTKEYLLRVLEDLNTYYSKNVLRWTARGLNPDLAFIKASLETEIKEEL